MKTIKELLEEYEKRKPQGKILYPRQELMKKFVDKLNSDRVAVGYKELPASFYAIKMYDAGLKTNFLLWWFWGYLNESKNFSKSWWWMLNPKNCK